MALDVLQTKLFIPIVSTHLVHRSHLIDRLNAGFRTKLALVIAPPGFGKSTLTAEWVRTAGVPVGWLSLDAGDNDPLRFFTYLLHAAHALDPARVAPPLSTLAGAATFSIESLLTDLINQLTHLSQRSILVLDDYHWIEDRAIHAGLAFFIERLPPSLHLVIATRSDPPVPLGRLRARGEMHELRIEDLRFRHEDIARLVHGATLPGGAPENAIALSPQDIAALEARTEGWIAGLQLALTSLAHNPDPAGFIRSFSGSHRYILDYLLEEVLDRQPKHIRDFLLKTSVLDRFCDELCAAVLTPSEQERMTPLDASATLAYLEHANLFLIPLDDDRRWFRYHHLFGDLLRHLLKVEQKQQISELHRRASGWFARQGLEDEAVEHAFAAGDPSLAAQIIARSSQRMVLNGEFTRLLRWAERLPVEILSADLELFTFYGWALLFTGQTAAVEEVTRALESAAEVESCYTAGAAVLRAFVETRRENYAVASRLSETAIQQIGPHPCDEIALLFQGVAQINLADIQRLLGKFDAAETAYRQAIDSNRRSGNLLGVLGCYRNLGDIAFDGGRLHQAAAIYLEGIDLAHGWAEKEFGAANAPLPSAQLFLRLAAVQYEWNDLENAAAGLEKAVHLLELSGSSFLPSGYYWLARLFAARQDAAAMDVCMENLRQCAAGLQTGGPAAHLFAQTDWLLTDLRLRRAGLPSSEQAPPGEPTLRSSPAADIAEWAQTASQTRPDAASTAFEPRDEILSRALLFLGKPEPAARLLLPLVLAARQSGRWRTAAERSILLALVFQRLGKVDAALEALGEALSLGESFGFVRMFLDEGEALRPLLGKAVQRKLAPGFAARLLAGITGSAGDRLYEPAANRSLIEPLTERELEVLALVAQGLSNQQIAARLFVALSTVKKHVNAIMGKLGAANRTDTVRLARDLGLLS